MSKFDAVVIGSGTGGLSAALSLATAGKKILLLEQHNMPGGCATSFVRGRFDLMLRFMSSALSAIRGTGQ